VLQALLQCGFLPFGRLGERRVSQAPHYIFNISLRRPRAFPFVGRVTGFATAFE
jgi:hypothetical protein